MPKLIAGGMPVVRPDPLRLDDCDEGYDLSNGILLQSDHHIGSSTTDDGLISTELEWAERSDSRVLLGGDIFDCLFPNDTRFRPEVLHPRLRGRSDIQNEALEWAVEIFGPYADLIDGIGVGNHEGKALIKSYFDIVGELVRRLNEYRDSESTPIAQMGWTSYVEYEVREGQKRLPSFTIWYHHGTAKTSESHRALRTLAEKSRGFQADLYWSGHSHALGHTAEIQMRVHRGRLIPRPVRYILTGSYMSQYQDQSQESMKSRGRKSNYAAEAGYNPHALGGAKVLLEWKDSPYPRVEVAQ